MKLFREFVAEAKTFSSREEGEKHHEGTPKGHYWNNSGSTEKPKWRLKPKSGGKAEREARSERLKSLSSSEDHQKAEKKKKHIQSRGYEAHHITPTHHSAKIKKGMSDSEWENKKKKDAKDGIYHGHHPKNLMATKKSTDSPQKPGVYHRKGGAHEIEGKVKDIVTGSSITHRDLMAAAVKRQRQNARKKKLSGSN